MQRKAVLAVHNGRINFMNTKKKLCFDLSRSAFHLTADWEKSFLQKWFEPGPFKENARTCRHDLTNGSLENKAINYSPQINLLDWQRMRHCLLIYVLPVFKVLLDLLFFVHCVLIQLSELKWKSPKTRTACHWSQSSHQQKNSESVKVRVRENGRMGESEREKEGERGVWGYR